MIIACPSIDSSSLTYDDAGNLTTDHHGYQYTYDYESRIIKIEDVNDVEVATFAYDALGRRIKKVDSKASETTYYYYNDQWQVLAEYDGSNNLQRYFIYGNYIDEPLIMNDTSNDYYYAHDHLYSPAALIEDDGDVAERYEYDAYGNCHVLDPDFSADADGLSDYDNPYTFTGRRLDSLDSGKLNIMYYRHRYYYTEIGRFLQDDPIGYMDGINLFEYVKSNPTILTDCYGLSCGCSEEKSSSEESSNDYFEQMECCACLAYGEVGGTESGCYAAIVATMKNRQKHRWGEASTETDFCAQAESDAWAGGKGFHKYEKCEDNNRCGTPVPDAEQKEINNAMQTCLQFDAGRAVDPTGGAQFTFAKGKASTWMLKQEKIGNCKKVNVPNCSSQEFWKCKKQPIKDDVTGITLP